MRPLTFPTPPQRILIIKPSSLGDVTHALPVLNLLRRRWPDSRISWLVSPACAGLLEGLSGLDEVILFDRRHFGTAWKNPAAGLDLIRFKRDLRHRHFDLVIDLQGLFRSGWLAWLTRAPVRIGFANARELAWIFYTHRVKIDTMDQHAVDRYLKIAAALGCDTTPVQFNFSHTDEHRDQIDALFAPLATGNGQLATPSPSIENRKSKIENPFALLLPGANWPTKRWPIENFASLVGPLEERFGLRSVVAGGPEIADLAARIPGALNLAGQTTLPQLVALIERAALVIANDSGPMHIASALGRPLVTIFGPTNPVRTGPYARPDSVIRVDIPCAPCYSRKCSHQSCLKWLTVEAVLEEAGRQMRCEKPSTPEIKGRPPSSEC